jgi:hypothetical protein
LLHAPEFSIEVDGAEYAYEVENPKEIVDMAIDNGKFWNMFVSRDDSGKPMVDENGNPKIDYNDFYEVAMFAKEREDYKKALIGLGRTLESKKLKNELNGGGETPRGGQPATTGGDWKDRFLQAAAAQKTGS